MPCKHSIADRTGNHCCATKRLQRVVERLSRKIQRMKADRNRIWLGFVEEVESSDSSQFRDLIGDKMVRDLDKWKKLHSEQKFKIDDLEQQVQALRDANEHLRSEATKNKMSKLDLFTLGHGRQSVSTHVAPVDLGRRICIAFELKPLNRRVGVVLDINDLIQKPPATDNGEHESDAKE